MAQGQKSTGTVKWFNATKGFGFITPSQGGDDLFVHQTSIISDGFRSLRDGEPVEFYVEAGDDGRNKAVQVTGPNGAPPQGSERQDFGGMGGGGGGGRGRGRGFGGGGYGGYGGYPGQGGGFGNYDQGGYQQGGYGGGGGFDNSYGGGQGGGQYGGAY